MCTLTVKVGVVLVCHHLKDTTQKVYEIILNWGGMGDFCMFVEDFVNFRIWGFFDLGDRENWGFVD